MDNHYLGAIYRTQSVSHLPKGVSRAQEERWQFSQGAYEGMLEVRGPHWNTCRFGLVAILIRGYAVIAGDTEVAKPDVLARFIWKRYRNTEELPISELEGNYTVVLLDGSKSRALLYRNLVGNGFTYYNCSAKGLVFGSNLADLVDAADRPLVPNEEALPSYFLYRFVPGRETLFRGFYRLMPGELLSFEGGVLGRHQKQAIGDFSQSGTQSAADAVEAVDRTMRQVLADQAAVSPAAANLLSGGVDSSIIQAIWNQVRPESAGTNFSYSVSVNHPRTYLDTHYALTVSRELSTHHVLVPADGAYADYLIESIATTGEPPNHVQSAYFGHLARVMVKRGVTTGLCGEGADSLFGIDAGDSIRTAALIRRLLPIPGLRHGL